MDEETEDPEASIDDLRGRRRRQLLADVTRFLSSHRLEVNANTLTFAHDVITGADQSLGALIEDRVAQRQPITLRWIEDFALDRRSDGTAAQLTSLMARVQGTMAEFGETTRAARTATSEYNSALSAHVDEAGDGAAAAPDMSELTKLTRLMLERTRELECAMEHSELQTRALRRDLDDARREASCDHLTGLPNRRAFEAVLEQQYAVAVRTGEPLCVAFCDVDFFKKVNDVHGHEAGDRVLREVAHTLAEISDDRCHVARHGGEEFVALICGRTLDESFRMLDGARAAMAARHLVNRITDQPFGRVTFSGGITDALAAGSPREALRRADAALLRAKSEGRNRICRADATMPIPAAA